MKKAFINTVHLEGRLYSHDLAEKVTGDTSKNPGTPYISGVINIATDDAMTNVVAVHFTYVAPMYPSGKANGNYPILKDIISGKIKNVVDTDEKQAAMLRIDSAIDLNEFYSDRNGEETLVSAKRNEGGFIHVVTSINSDESVRNKFTTDMVITGVNHREADDEKNLAERAIVKGCVFNFRKAMLPIEFVTTNPAAIAYFEGLDASSKNPIFTKVWGKEVSTTIVRKIVEESAFGEPSVREVTSSRKDFIITGASTEPYEWDDESTLTATELKEMMAERQTYLATVKKNQDDYKAAQAAPKSPAKSGGFDF